MSPPHVSTYQFHLKIFSIEPTELWEEWLLVTQLIWEDLDDVTLKFSYREQNVEYKRLPELVY